MKMNVAALVLGGCFLLAGFSQCAAEESNPNASQPKYSPHVKQIIIVFKTHFDIGYTDLARNVINDYRTTMMDRTLAVIDQNRDLPRDQQFVWTIPGWPMTQMLWTGQDPQRRLVIEQVLRDGNLIIHGLPFTTHTETLELEDLVRGLGFSSQMARQYGLELPRDGKMTDVCGHTWVMPTLLKHAGIDFFHIGANIANQKARVPNLFWWEGPDGSRLLTIYSGDYGTAMLPPPDWPHATWLALLSTIDNVGPPSPKYLRQTLDTIRKEAPNVKVVIGRLSDFSDALLAENPDLPVVRGDLSDVWIHGPMSGPAGCKIARHTRPRMASAEKLATLSRLWGLNEPDPAETIAQAYEKSLLYGEHTWGLATQNYVRLAYGQKAWEELLANGLPENYRICEESYDEHESYIKDAQALIEPVLSSQLKSLAKNVNIGGFRIVVFNPLPWQRTGLVEVTIEGEVPAGLKAVDDDRLVPATFEGQILRFLAADIPAMGYRTFVAAARQSRSDGLAADANTNTLESPFFKAQLDPQRGLIASLIDKRTGRELVEQSAPHGFGQYLYERLGRKNIDDNAREYILPAWHRTHDYGVLKFDMPDAPYESFTAAAMQCEIRRTPLAVTALMTAPATKVFPQNVSIALTLYNDLPAADLEVSFEKKPDGWPEACWISLPLAIEAPHYQLGRVGSIIDPTTDIIDGCNFHMLWLNTGMTVSEGNGPGVGLCAIDNPLVSLGEPGSYRWSLRYVPEHPRIYFNLFNNQYHTNFRSWWGGSLSSRVRLWTFDQYDAVTSLYQPSIEARNPLLAAEYRGTAGSLPTVQTGLDISASGVEVTAFGTNPDGPGIILRLWEQGGKGGECTVQMPQGLPDASLQPVDLRGQPHGEPVPVHSGRFTFHLRPFAPASFVIMPD